MAKFKFSVSTGYVGSELEEIIEIPDEELEGLDELERENQIWSWYNEWLDLSVSKDFYEV